MAGICMFLWLFCQRFNFGCLRRFWVSANYVNYRDVWEGYKGFPVDADPLEYRYDAKDSYRSKSGWG